MQTKKLFAGERLVLADDNALLKIISGKLEVYAVTKQQGEETELSFRQCYLVELHPDEMAFPALDEFAEIHLQVYAVADTEYTLCPLAEVETAELLAGLNNWFVGLYTVPWVRLLADKGDDMLQMWPEGKMFWDKTTRKEILAAFTAHQQIFSMLLGVRFGSEDKRLSRRVLLRKKTKARLVENGIRSLLGEESLFVGEDGEYSQNVGEAILAVKRVAKALGAPTETIGLSEENARALDEVSILRRLMQKGNMQMRLVTLPPKWYEKDSGVLLGFYRTTEGKKEMAAFIPVTEKSYRLYSRSAPDGIPLTPKEGERLEKDAFQCYAGFPGRALTLLDLIKFMFRQCWPADYRTILLCSLFAGLIPLATPIITETIFQDIIPILDRQGLATVTQALMVTGFTTAALSIVRSVAVLRIAGRLEIAAEAALWGRLLQLPTKFFRRYTVGELAGRMGGLGVAKNLASGEFIGSVLSFCFSFWSIFLMCYYSLKLTAAAIGVWLVYALFVAVVLRRVLFFQRKIIAAANKTAGTVQQIFAGLAKFRVQGAEEQAYSLWTKTFGEHWNWSLKLRWQNNYTAIIGSVQPFVLTLILYWVAVYGLQEVGPDGKTVQQGIGYAQFIAFSAAYSSFNAVMGGIIGLISQYFAIQPQLENLQPILEAVPETAGEKPDIGSLTGALEVSHLSFAYPNNEADGSEGEEILQDVSFSVKAGENVAIVGKSGSGKSTLVRLLLGFEIPQSGAVYFDGQDMADFNLPSVRSQMGVVLQNGQLMTGSIFSNIVGTKLFSQDEAWEAAEAAGIADDIAAMPMGMQTVIAEGSSNISGGQRQRLLIARALVGKPAILILDEATSALDNRSQAIVTSSLNRLHATRLIVAHRLSTVRGCDRIIVLDGGRVAETGTYAELTARQGIFSELAKRQVV